MSSDPITGVFNDGYISEAYEAYRRDPSVGRRIVASVLPICRESQHGGAPSCSGTASFSGTNGSRFSSRCRRRGRARRCHPQLRSSGPSHFRSARWGTPKFRSEPRSSHRISRVERGGSRQYSGARARRFGRQRCGCGRDATLELPVSPDSPIFRDIANRRWNRERSASGRRRGSVPSRHCRRRRDSRGSCTTRRASRPWRSHSRRLRVD